MYRRRKLWGLPSQQMLCSKLQRSAEGDGRRISGDNLLSLFQLQRVEYPVEFTADLGVVFFFCNCNDKAYVIFVAG